MITISTLGEPWDDRNREKVIANFSDNTDLKTIDIPNGAYIADRYGERFSISVVTVGNWETKVKVKVVTVERIIEGPVVKFIKHHSRAIPKGTIAVLLGDSVDYRYNCLVTSKGIYTVVRSSILRDYSIDRLSPKMREWAILRMLEG